jgi:valyl-tRNA synthetase
VAAPFDNSPEKSSNESSLHTGEGVVIDIGTGDGRFVSASARANPNKFYIGVDANTKPLEKPSMKATRKPAATGTGRFGNWLENMVDWNLSRSRFWGTPLPIWKTEDAEEEKEKKKKKEKPTTHKGVGEKKKEEV